MHATAIPLWASIPFFAFLLMIAVMPLVAHAWWNRHYAFVAIPLGIVVAVADLVLFGAGTRIVHTALDYFSFIVLLGSLFVVSGGILIRIEGRAHPLINAVILVIGALIANIVGTTGASMLLIRPYLHVNQARLKPYLVVFFIFIVGNIGGALTPIGDPPLFLGYLRGVPFFWVLQKVWPAWLLATGLVLAVFLVVDWRHHRGIRPLEEAVGRSRLVLRGWYNFFFLAVILFAVFKPTPVRELLMLAAAGTSFWLTPRSIHREHHFHFAPIVEVAILFFAIFATMMPALDWLEANARGLALSTPGSYYWATGVLSSFLDNAPTYLSFLSASMGFTGLDVAGMLAGAPAFVVAISLGAVFFGAMTYIGNGPNFMVKSIADHRGVRCPSFFGYMLRYSIPVLLPVFALVWFLFLR